MNQEMEKAFSDALAESFRMANAYEAVSPSSLQGWKSAERIIKMYVELKKEVDMEVIRTGGYPIGPNPLTDYYRSIREEGTPLIFPKESTNE